MDRRIASVTPGGLLKAIADLAMPRPCVICGTELLHSEDNICTECLADLPETRFWTQSRNPMADRFNALIDAPSYCYAAALIFYGAESPYRMVTQSLKYSRNLRSGRYFAAMLAERLSESEQFRDVDAVVPVPLHWTRRWKRGYNQAEIIAQVLAEKLDAECVADALKRCRRTKSQTTLSIAEKEKNVRGAFVAGEKAPVSAKHILLVDDVFTTGSTLAACYRALRQVVGSEARISIATLAFVN